MKTKRLDFMLNRLIGFVLLLLLVTACSDGKLNLKKIRFTKRDLSITPQNSFTDLFLDSMRLEQFISKQNIDSSTAQHMRSFYNSRNYQFAWFNKEGLNEPGLSFWNLYTSFLSLSKDSTLFDSTLGQKMDGFMNDDTYKAASPQQLATTELELTQHFFKYAKVAYAGRVNPEELQWFIPRKKVDALALLDSLVARNGKISEEEWEPVNPEYQTLKEQLIRFNKMAENGGWAPIYLPEGKKLKLGDSSSAVLETKKRLFASGDLQQMDSSAVFDSTLYNAVLFSQKRFGFHQDGIVDASLVKELNVPVRKRIEQIMINLERMRWLPEKPAPNRIVANIPEFRIHVYENNKEAFSMDIVVGKEGHNTVIFNDLLKYIVFSPYWNVPASIVKHEIQPAMNRNPGYLASHNMEITGHRGGLPVIRQKPGPRNSLGRVKFLFPNNYNIYFHDTPAKSLFNREKRAFSHGCMRLANAEKLAVYLLRDQPEWTREKIEAAMHASKEKWVTLKEPVPVFVSYFTAWVDDQGQLNFRDDIYGHDKKMAERLFIHTPYSADSAVVAGLVKKK